LKIYFIKQKIYSNHQDEWYVYHSDLSCYVSDCSVHCTWITIHFFIVVLNWTMLYNAHCPFVSPFTFMEFLGTTFYAPATKSGGILIYPCPSVRPSGYRYMVCPAISFYSFGATALIFCRMFIHIMEVCMSTRFWFSSNILKMTGSWT
jgi:hypothetical protein